jgi:malate dehydrogenase (oxaloacetate-decarboxylating)(NADP+)
VPYDYTSKGNLVAVISNGTAILGLGNLGALASKPVMEGKAVLFKRFADVDSIDLEVDTEDCDKFIEAVSHCSSRASAGSTSRTSPPPTAS